MFVRRNVNRVKQNEKRQTPVLAKKRTNKIESVVIGAIHSWNFV